MIPKPINKTICWFENGETIDIQKVLLKVARKTVSQTVAFAKRFAPTEQGLKDLHDWMFQNIKYVIDPEGEQNIKHPSRAYAERHLGTDCKTYTVFGVTVVINMGLEVIVRFASYSLLDPTPTHVYFIAILPSGKEVIIDVVYSLYMRSTAHFNRQKGYYHKQDFKMNGTRINELAGIGSMDGASIGELVDYYYSDVLAGLPEYARSVVDMTEAEYLGYIGSSAIGSSEPIWEAPEYIGVPKKGGKLLNVGKQILAAGKKGAKVILDVVLKPIVNNIMESQLSGTADYFLFMFVPKKYNTGAVTHKRDYQRAYISKFAKLLRIKEDIVYSKLRSVLEKKFGKKIDAYIEEEVKNYKPKVGLIPLVVGGAKVLFGTIIKQLAAAGLAEAKNFVMPKDDMGSNWDDIFKAAGVLKKPDPKPNPPKPDPKPSPAPNPPKPDPEPSPDPNPPKPDPNGGGSNGMMIGLAVAGGGLLLYAMSQKKKRHVSGYKRRKR